MNLPKDCTIKISLEMDLPTLNNFIHTCKENFKVAINIYNFKRYKKEHYSIMLGIYRKKQEILALLKNVKCHGTKIPILKGGSRNTKFKIEYKYLIKMNDIVRYSQNYDIYHNNADFEAIMNVEDPNIKLEKLRQLIYSN